MAETSDRIEEALAAYLDHLEMGGPQPDTSHLSSSELQQLQELIDALELTEGVAFGRGGSEPTGRAEAETQLLTHLRGELPADVRIERDATAFITHIGGIEIVEHLLVGTFGGRVKVWLLDAERAQVIEENDDSLNDLNRAFRALSDTAAIALVAGDLTCLVVQPQDCAPRIQVPSGALVARRYRRSIHPVGEAISSFLDELIPYWDPIPVFDPDTGLHIDTSDIGDEFAKTAIARQRASGERARKGNPKKEALLALGEEESAALMSLTNGLLEGSVGPGEVAERLERLARER